MVLDEQTTHTLEAWWFGLPADDRALVREHAEIPSTGDPYVCELVDDSGFPMLPAINWDDTAPQFRMAPEILDFVRDTVD